MSGAINQEGNNATVTAPYGPAQKKMAGVALKKSLKEPIHEDAVECHATVTAPGGPIEIGMLAAAISRAAAKAQGSLIGPLGGAKSNIGHLEAAHATDPIHQVVTLRQELLDAVLDAVMNGLHEVT